MTAAYRLKSLGWFAGLAIVSIGFYLVSMQVAEERKRLARVDARILSAARDIRALETEFDVRANLAQLERWNGDTLALVAPAAGQFVRDEGQLAAISFGPAAAGAGEAVRSAQLIVPSRPSEAIAPAVIDEGPAAPAATLVQVAARPAAPKAAIARPIVTAAVALAPKGETPAATLRKARAVAMLDRSLLSDTTLGDLLSGARAEGGRRR